MRSLADKARPAMQRGFTLVELLIVVIILAILAAIVIPQFSSATVRRPGVGAGQQPERPALRHRPLPGAAQR